MGGYSSRTRLVGLVVLGWVLAPLISGEDEPLSKPDLVIAPHCRDKCGNVSIPYPFGLEEGCYLKEKDPNEFPYYKIKCNNSTTPPTPIFGLDLELLRISINGSLRINHHIAYNCYDNKADQPIEIGSFNASVRSGRFTISGTENILVGMGCDTSVWFVGYMNKKRYNTGCMTTCYNLEDVTNENCNGVGCCKASFPEGVANIKTTLYSFWNHSEVPFNPCSVAFAVAKDAFKFNKNILTKNLDYFQDEEYRPVILNWAVGNESCSVAKENDDDFLCKENTICEDPPNQVGYRCKCKSGFHGNPYHPNGCSDIDECQRGLNDCKNPGYCVNYNGGYHCQCPKGYKGNGTIAQPCISHKNTWLIPVLATAGIGGGIITLLVIGFILQWKHGKRQIREMRDNNFRQNGGLLLHEKLSSRRELDTLKIYTTQDLEIATNNYSNDNVLGRGGFGIVYKGIMSNHQVVAIKKSLRVDPNQVEQFINEVLVLSQIKNKFVVKLLGCCLETDVPLLVYEFINNGTLYEHLDDGVRASILKWPLRLKIASQVANVLSYLHYTTTTPIIHRDIKSMNILLDESYTAKVADFGASRLVPPDQNQFATMVLGTQGYLDPEYLQTGELTEKSDVYSFGVVLVELLTRKKAISNERREIEKSLAMHFLIMMKEGHLFEILDKNILTEGAIEDIQQMANLAKWCLMLKGEERPTMKEVAMELDNLTRKGLHPWSDDGSFQKDCEPLLTRGPRLDDGGCSTGTIDSNSYDSQLLSSLGNGR